MKSDLSWLPGPEHETFLCVCLIDLVDITLVKKKKKPNNWRLQTILNKYTKN